MCIHQFTWQKFSNPGKTCFVHRLGLTPGLALDLRTGWDLNDLAQRAKMWLHLQQERPILLVGYQDDTHMRWMIDVYRWQVSQGRFFVHQETGHLLVNTELCAMKSVLVSRVDWCRTKLTKCEENTQQFFQVDP